MNADGELLQLRDNSLVKYFLSEFNLPLRWAVSRLDNKLYLDNFKCLDRFNAMQELSDFKDWVVSRRVSLGKWIKEVSSCDCFFYYNLNEKKAFWNALLSKVLK